MRILKNSSSGFPTIVMEAEPGDHIPTSIVYIHNGKGHNYIIEEAKK